jgi:hypothetical protein
MPSTISAGTTAGTALNFVSDTTGNLAFQTNGTTTAMTIDTNQNVTYANGVSFTGVIGGNGANISSMNASNLTSGTVANARTTAASANGASTIVLRDTNGAFGGNLANCTVDGTNAVGYRNVPQSGSDKTTSYTLTTGDIGEFVGVGSSGSITIPNSTFAAGDVISFFNNTTGNVTITCSITTAYIAGTNTDKDTMTLATRGVATVLFISGTVCVVSGNVS